MKALNLVILRVLGIYRILYGRFINCSVLMLPFWLMVTEFLPMLLIFIFPGMVCPCRAWVPFIVTHLEFALIHIADKRGSSVKLTIAADGLVAGYAGFVGSRNSAKLGFAISVSKINPDNCLNT